MPLLPEHAPPVAPPRAAEAQANGADPTITGKPARQIVQVIKIITNGVSISGVLDYPALPTG
jgi:hypothetical protein